MRLSGIDWIAIVLVIIGGLNWGLVGIFDFNLVTAIFGDMSSLSRVIYALVGLSALVLIYTTSKMRGGNGMM
ncbi:DUF378 domain-containing protein [Candidatus Kaiserbacteria bacterium]|nr:DUF378 domain-containing protein [Candidatus Kaiserbacteria bacterium]